MGPRDVPLSKDEMVNHYPAKTVNGRWSRRNISSCDVGRISFIITVG